MNMRWLVDHVYKCAMKKDIHMDKKDIGFIVAATFQAIEDSIIKFTGIKIRNFGVFKCVYRAEHKTRDPRNQDTIMVPGKWAPKFIPGNTLKKRIAATKRGKR